VRFSSRVPSDLSVNRLAAAVARLAAGGGRLLDLTLSNPTRAGFTYPADLLAALSDPAGLAYEPSPLGSPAARGAVARDYARRGLAVDPDRLALTASTSEAYSILFKLLCDPDDEVLVPAPSYPLVDHLTRLEAVRVRPYRLDYHGAWRIDLADLEAAFGDRTRAVLVVNPNNPTGSRVQRDELEAIARLCGDRAAIVGDEVFGDYGLQESDGAARSVLEAREALVFSLGGLSKSVGLPQVKLGWIALGGPEALVDAARLRLELICDTYLSVSTAVQVAAPALLERGAVVRRQIQARIAANYESLAREAARHPACALLRAEGGWYAVLRTPSTRPEEALVVDLVERDGVLVHPGYFFEFAAESFLVVSLLVPPGEFVEAIGRIFERIEAD
jgi:aspartate/methionine/tyrosine aminotransferase